MVALALKVLNRCLLRLSTLLVWSLTKLVRHPFHIRVVELSSATGASASLTSEADAYFSASFRTPRLSGKHFWQLRPKLW